MTMYRPTAGQAVFLSVLAAAALGCSLYLRYRVIQNSDVGIACDAGAGTAICFVRTWTTNLFEYSVFGCVALAAAALHLFRPALAPLALGLLAAGLGIVLYNVLLSGIAVGLMILAFARPAHRPA